MTSMKYRLTIGESPDSFPAHPHNLDYDTDHPTREAAEEAAQDQNDGRPVRWHETVHQNTKRAQLSRQRVAEIEEQHSGPLKIDVSTSLL